MALIVGIQLFLWALSGFYMVAVHIDIIHGDMLVKNMRQTVGNVTGKKVALSLSMNQIAQRYPKTHTITLKSLLGNPVYLIKSQSNTDLLDAETGEQLSPLSRETILKIARYHYAGEGQIRLAEQMDGHPDTELHREPRSKWRIDFDDGWNSSFYIDPSSGQFIKRRHTLWHIFDFLWMLHIMDYDDRDNVNNTLLQIFSVAGVLFASSGIWLLFYSFKNSRPIEKTI